MTRSVHRCKDIERGRLAETVDAGEGRVLIFGTDQQRVADGAAIGNVMRATVNRDDIAVVEDSERTPAERPLRGIQRVEPAAANVGIVDVHVIVAAALPEFPAARETLLEQVACRILVALELVERRLAIRP
jgi:hypothetical protein